MALSNDLRKRVVEAVVEGRLSRNAAAKRFKVSVASAVRWVKRYETTGKISPAPSGGDRRSGRVEAQREYLLGLIRRTPDVAARNPGPPDRQLRRAFLGFRALALLRPSRDHIQKRPPMRKSSTARTF
jgi:transposase-like protein